MKWIDVAECTKESVDPELFFPSGNTDKTVEMIDIAKGICNKCFAKQNCIDWSIEHKIDAGIWGGLSEEERRTIRRKIRNKKKLEQQEA
jgi:WhiB family redox-sensing transcriptional regulator